MTQSQLNAVVTDRTSQAEKVAAVLRLSGPTSVNEIAKILGLPPGRITARLAKLQENGRAFCVDPTADMTLYDLEHDESQWPVRARAFQKGKDLEQFAKAVKVLKPYLSGPIVELLRGVYRKKMAS